MPRPRHRKSRSRRQPNLHVCTLKSEEVPNAPLPHFETTPGTRMKQDRTWIVVADGAKARILLYKPHQKGVQQLPDGEFHDSHPATHDLVTERQPRVHDSVGHARHAVEPRIDPHDQRETRFLTRLAAHLDGAEQRGEFEHLVVVAPLARTCTSGCFPRSCTTTPTSPTIISTSISKTACPFEPQDPNSPE